MLAGRQLGPFQVEREIGAGAMGAVYRAKNTQNGQFVAIKMMASGLGSNATGLARFEREANILKQLKHPNIVRLIATGKYQGQPFYAMEYIDGESLDHVMARRGRMSWEEVIAIGQQLCAALQYAHEKGIIHRDLKPSNLMVLRDGTVKLTDFGIAKDVDVTQLTSAHCTVGTAAYMSPEQCKGERDLTYKSDLYSLGVMLYELVTGRKPFLADTPMDMFLQHVQGTFERPSRLVLDLPVWLDTLICQLLEKLPENRPVDAAMVGQVLGQIEEKVTAQKSAGADAVEARRVDRPRNDDEPDEADLSAARALAVGLGKFKVRRRKKRSKPIFERKWFQAIVLSAFLAVIAYIGYLVFKPASAAKLYARIETAMQSQDPDTLASAREGPIADYLKRFGKQDDEQTRQVHAWADKIDADLRERQLRNRMRRKFDPENDTERAAMFAVRREDDGDLEALEKAWANVRQRANTGSEDDRVWGLLAERRLTELKQLDTRDVELKKRVQEARLAARKFETADDMERDAAEAIRYELFGDEAAALGRWLVIDKKSAKEPDLRSWHLLALKKIAALRNKLLGPNKEVPSPDEVKAWRVRLVQDRITQAQKLPAIRETEAQAIYRDVVTLYGDNPELKDEVERARGLIKE